MTNSRIGTIEAIMLIVNVIVVHSVLSLPRTLIDLTKSATILNLLYVTVIILGFIYGVCKLLKFFPGMDILDISEILGGKLLHNILGFIFILHFILSSSFILRSFSECLKVVSYPSTGLIFIIFFIIIGVSAVNYLQFNASIKTNLLLIPFVLISIMFLFLANFKNFIPQRIFPILGDGFKQTFIVGLQNISAFGSIIFLYFLPPLLKRPEKFKKIAFISVILSAIYLVLAVCTILFMFVFSQNVNETMPLYSAAAYIEFGGFFQRLDSVFLLIWTLSFTCYLSIVSKICLYIFRKISNIKETKAIIFPFSFTMFAIALFPKNSTIAKYYETNIYPYAVIGLVFFVSFFILVLSYFKRRKKIVPSVFHPLKGMKSDNE